MKNKLIPCKSCGQSIAKSATTCPHCGKKFTSVAGIFLACLLGLVVGWLLISRTCSQADEADERIEQLRRR